MGAQSGSDAKGTSLPQRLALIAAYQRTGNMAAAMREAGIRSPRTAYLWWHRYQQDGEAGLLPRSRARKTQRTVPVDVAAEAAELRRAHPDWGRRRIARALRERHGRPVISPAGVEAVLRRAGLWVGAAKPPPVAPPPAVAPSISRHPLDDLLPLVVEGIAVGLNSRPAAAVAILGDRVWRRLGSDRRAWSRLLADPAVGPLLLRSRVELGRSLMNSGRWRAASEVFEETIGWLKQAPPEADDPPPPVPGVAASLRRDDAWIESYQYLAIVLRDRRPDAARGYLRIALDGIRSRSGRLVPLHRALAEGNLERDLATLLLRAAETPDAEIEAHLRAASDLLEEAGDQAMMAATEMTQAKAAAWRAERARGEDRATWRSALDAVERSLDRAMGTLDGLDSPMLQANFYGDAARLALAHGLVVDERRLRRAATLCVTNGYGGQARQLLVLPGVERFISREVLGKLADAARTADLDADDAGVGRDRRPSGGEAYFAIRAAYSSPTSAGGR